MRKWYVIVIILGSIVAVRPSDLSAGTACAPSDKACREFERLTDGEQFEEIIAKVNPKGTYSPAARDLIGRAYLMVAGKETNTPEQEEQFCRKALEYGATSAYMGLYFIHADRDTDKALGFLKQYVETQPQDSVPYVILGEAELARNNYTAANEYLTKARTVARGKSSNLDWLLFQSSYLTGDYSTSATMLDQAFAHGKTVGDLKALIAQDPRFGDLGKKNEFRKVFPMINGSSAFRLSFKN